MVIEQHLEIVEKSVGIDVVGPIHSAVLLDILSPVNRRGVCVKFRMSSREKIFSKRWQCVCVGVVLLFSRETK